MVKILVTGASGAVGRVIVPSLQRRGHEVIGFDRIVSPDVEKTHMIVADISDQKRLRQAVRDVDCVIHFAATPDEADFKRFVTALHTI